MNSKILFFSFFILFFLGVSASKCAQIQQGGITWFFDKEYDCGQFTNGDYWVVADSGTNSVAIQRISPEFTTAIYRSNFSCASNSECSGKKLNYGNSTYSCQAGKCVYSSNVNGVVVNPKSHTAYQSFDGRLLFDSNQLVATPFNAKPNSSILKVVSSDMNAGEIIGLRGFGGSTMILREAAVLTVIASAPLFESFRPPYYSDQKPLYRTVDVNWALLPSLEPPIGVSIPGFSILESQVKKVQMDHITHEFGDYYHPALNMPHDGGDIARRNNETALKLLLNNSLEEKKNLAIFFIQQGIDLYYMGITGETWSAGGQVSPGRKLPITFAAVLLNDSNMKNFVKNAGTFQFQENVEFNFTLQSGQVLWSQDRNPSYFTDAGYWKDFTGVAVSSKTAPDPYYMIDGGATPGGSYLASAEAQNAKAVALALHLFPELKPVFNDNELIEFADRWVYQGIWTQPDPCAPATGICRADSGNPRAACTSANVKEICKSGTQADALNWCEYNWSEYGTKYGPNAVSKSCILDMDPSDGIGRVPGTMA